MNPWDRRFLELASLVSTWSKDPSTGCGCALVDDDKRVLSLGFNGFPQKVKDLPERLMDRATKLMLVQHAERNAIAFARQSLKGTTAYVYPLMPCSQCAGALIQVGIRRIVSPSPTAEQTERWGKDWELADVIYKDAETTVDLYAF